jgi:hypothetical protein
MTCNTAVASVLASIQARLRTNSLQQFVVAIRSLLSGEVLAARLFK